MKQSPVVYVHGMWMPGAEMLYLQRHLKKYGFDGHLFDYPSVAGSLDENSELLSDFIREIDADEVHLVGHSLGGVLALRMLSLNPEAPPGRVVCIGSPLCGSRAANAVTSSDWGRALLGKTVSDGVVQSSATTWATAVVTAREVGSIAGTLAAGLGRLVANFDEPNDGTVAVSETRLPGISDHLCLPISHSGLVLSTDVADQVAAFLREGRFHHRTN